MLMVMLEELVSDVACANVGKAMPVARRIVEIKIIGFEARFIGRTPEKKFVVPDATCSTIVQSQLLFEMLRLRQKQTESAFCIEEYCPVTGSEK